jgi:hypothetical protein
MEQSQQDLIALQQTLQILIEELQDKAALMDQIMLPMEKL